jgi:hypothetical protein
MREKRNRQGTPSAFGVDPTLLKGEERKKERDSDYSNILNNLAHTKGGSRVKSDRTLPCWAEMIWLEHSFYVSSYHE